jgi:hypothetical protein
MLDEWWTYRPADFLMFAPQHYWRLYASINQAWWPIGLLLTLAATQALVRRHFATMFLVAAWACGFTAWQFLQLRFLPINWAVQPFVWAFAAQALALAWLWLGARTVSGPRQARRARPGATASPEPLAQAGAVLAFWALLGHPLLAAAQGRPLAQAALFGLAPDPTMLFTLGVLMLWAAPVGWRLAAAVVPVAWCLFSGLFRLAMAG